MSQSHLDSRCACGGYREPGDFHAVCLSCLGERHLKEALVKRPSCLGCAAFDYRGRLQRLLRFQLRQTNAEVLGLEDAIAQDRVLHEHTSRARRRSTPSSSTQREPTLSFAGSAHAVHGERTALRRLSSPGGSDGANASLATPVVATDHRGMQTVDSSESSGSASSGKYLCFSALFLSLGVQSRTGRYGIVRLYCQDSLS